MNHPHHHPAFSVEQAELEGYLHVRELPEAGICGIMPMMFTHALIAGMNRYGYEDRWCYRSEAAALAALDAWDGSGEPAGWHRHPDTGRRVDDDGRQYVKP